MWKRKKEKKQEKATRKADLNMDSVLWADAWHGQARNPDYEIRGNARYDFLFRDIQRERCGETAETQVEV